MNKDTKRMLLISGFIWIIANFHHPITPTLFTELNMPDHLFGTSYALMVLGMMFTSSLWGSIGDRGYRKETLALVTFLYGTVQILFGFTTSITGIVILRVLGGMTASGFHVGLMSALVDLNNKENRSKVMANYAAIMSISQAIGFLIGGGLGYLPTRYVFFIQGISMILVSLSIKFFIPGINEDKRGTEGEVKFVWDIIREARTNKDMFTPWIKRFLGITFFIGIAYSGYNNAFNYFLKAELNLKPMVNGIWKAVVGILALISNLTINVWLIENKDLKRSLMALIAISTISSFAVYLNQELIPFFLASFLFFIIYTIQVPILQDFAVGESSVDVGLMSGIFNSVKSFGEMIGSSAAGIGYEIDSRLPFLIGAIAYLVALFLSFIEERRRIDT